MENIELHSALATVFEIVEFLNLDIDRVKPWISMKEDPSSANTEISDWLLALSVLSEEIEPFLPGTSKE
jgi:methionyl-tRNA synthetase